MELKLQSDEIDKLTTAFIAACLEIEGFKADKKGNYGMYVSINEIKRAAYKICLKYGVQYKQGTIIVDGHTMLCTKITHTSGQWEAFYGPLYTSETSKRDPNQDIGASSSYQRRYALYGLFGILGEDLDPDSSHSQDTSKQHETIIDEFATSAQVYLIKKFSTDIQATILKDYNVESIESLFKKEASECITKYKDK